MKTAKTFLLAVAALVAAHVSAAIVYSDSGTTGPSSAYVVDGTGGFIVAYQSATWSAFVDDGAESGQPMACYSYILETDAGLVVVFAVNGGPSLPDTLPTGPGWTFWSYYTDLGASASPDFLTAFWAVAF